MKMMKRGFLAGALAISLILNGIGVWVGGRLFCHQLEVARIVEKNVETVKCNDPNLMNSGFELKYVDAHAVVYSSGEGNSTNILYYYKASRTNEYYFLGCDNNMSQYGKGHKTSMYFCSDDIFALWRYGATGQCERVLLRCKSQPCIFDALGDGNIKYKRKRESQSRKTNE